jgi:hypothetical protein
MHEQTEHVDQDVSLLALDLLAGVIPDGIDAGPPFSALLALWLSITPAVGSAFRSACSRHFSNNARWICFIVPS